MSEFGELLRHARAYKGVTLRDAERATRINRHHLAALEREEFEELPPLIYARGIVRNYAQYLGLDPVAVLALFEEVHGQRSGGFRVVPAVKPLNIPSHWAPNFAIIAFMVIMSAVIFAWLYGAFFSPPDTVPTEQPGLAGQGSPGATPPASPESPGLAPTATGTAEREAATVTPVASPMPPVVAATPEPTPTSTQQPTPTPTTHRFAITATNSVWVQVTVDGSVVFSDVLGAGQTRTFEGQQMYVTSGNAPFIRVSVDGVDQGPLGTTWDASRTYPAS
ncbi:MAG: DUF4115 domain-containing protein [Sphaerobacter sp.]|nr:DUF4115 domain-containing protein [Sphaerobacter sp.]